MKRAIRAPNFGELAVAVRMIGAAVENFGRVDTPG
jgi:hypothetical protein